MPTSSHVFYIPLVLLVGIILGIIIGRRSILVQQAEDARQKQLAERRAARASSAKPSDTNGPNDTAQPPAT